MAEFIQKNFTPPIMVAFGNPLVDICADPPSDEILKKYNIQIDGQIELEGEEFLSLMKDVAAVIKGGAQWAGGSVQNTSRLFQWLIGIPGYTVLFGAIGVDENGKFLEERISRAGVITKFIYHEDHQTGACLTFIDGEIRSLVAHLGAANFCPIDLDLAEHLEIIKNSKLVYMEGFFITHGFQMAKKIVGICNASETCLGVNLSAPYVCEKFTKEIIYLVESAGVIFGNMCEFLALCKSMNWHAETPNDVAINVQKHWQKMSRLPCQKQCWKKKLPDLLLKAPIIVITDGKHDVTIVEGVNKPPISYPIPELPKHLIKDTTGAGDAFVAGFLAAMFCEFDINVCVEWGCQTAAVIIQEIGVLTPTAPPSWVQNPS